MVATTQITINGTNYEGRITDIGTQSKETKAAGKNVKGGSFTFPARARAGCQALQFTFPYCSGAQRAELQGIFEASAVVTLDHANTLDFTPGTYLPIDFAETRIKELDQIGYNILLTFAQDTPSALVKTLTPVNDGSLTHSSMTPLYGL